MIFLQRHLNLEIHFYFQLLINVFFCSHGDVYNIHRHPDCNYDVLVFGHTHQGMIIRDGGRYYINPGSVSTPKADHLNSYLIVDDRGIFLKNFEQSILNMMLW